MTAPDKPVILLVEDDEGDVLLLREALKTIRTPHRLEAAWDGEEALDYLHRRGSRFESAVQPELIILDLNLPRVNGREVFARIKAEPRLQNIPLVVLTTSTWDADIVAGRDPARNLYLSKPMRLQGYIETVAAIEAFWLAARPAPKA